MIYQEYPISEILKPYVKVIWLMESDCSTINGPPIHILLDACVEISCSLWRPFQNLFGGWIIYLTINKSQANLTLGLGEKSTYLLGANGKQLTVIAYLSGYFSKRASVA